MTDVTNPSVTLNPAEAPKWSDWITEFDTSYNLFMQNYNALIQLHDYVYTDHPELRAQYDKLMSDAQKRLATLKELKQVRDTVAGWLSSLGHVWQGALNITGIQAGIDWLKGQFGLGEMGQITIVVGVVAASAALVAVAKWTKDAFVFAQRINALKALEAKGMSPQAAAGIVNKTLGNPNAGFLGIPIKWIAVAATAVVVGPPLIKMLENRRG